VRFRKGLCEGTKRGSSVHRLYVPVRHRDKPLNLIISVEKRVEIKTYTFVSEQPKTKAQSRSPMSKEYLWQQKKRVGV